MSVLSFVDQLGQFFQGGMKGRAEQKARMEAQRNFEWQRRTQEKTWKREDNAVQRRVKDLKKAGLSPTLAAGSAASSQATQAPQRSGTEKAAQALSLMKMKADIGRTNAQAQLLQSQARLAQGTLSSSIEQKRRENRFAEETYTDRKKVEKWKNYAAYWKKSMADLEYQIKHIDWKTISGNRKEYENSLRAKWRKAHEEWKKAQYNLNWYEEHRMPVQGGLGDKANIGMMIGADRPAGFYNAIIDEIVAKLSTQE